MNHLLNDNLPDNAHDISEPQTTVSETRTEYLLRTGRAKPRFLQGVFPCVGYGIYESVPLNDALSYVVPQNHVARIQYFRAGNPSEDLIYLTLNIDGKPARFFPVGPKSDLHVPLAIIEPHPPGTRIEIAFAAPRGMTGTVIVDVGLTEEADKEKV